MAIKQEVPCFIQVCCVSSVICISCCQGKQNNTAGCVMTLKVNYIAQRRASQQMLNLERLCPYHDATFKRMERLFLSIPLGFFRLSNGQSLLFRDNS